MRAVCHERTEGNTFSAASASSNAGLAASSCTCALAVSISMASTNTSADSFIFATSAFMIAVDSVTLATDSKIPSASAVATRISSF